MVSTLTTISVCLFDRKDVNYDCLFSLQHVFTDIDGKLLYRLYKMKVSATDSYYKFLDKYIDHRQTAQMSDILRFDHELDRLFQH